MFELREPSRDASDHVALRALCFVTFSCALCILYISKAVNTPTKADMHTAFPIRITMKDQQPGKMFFIFFNVKICICIYVHVCIYMAM